MAGGTIILGGTGKIGRAFTRKLKDVIPLSKAEVDVTKLSSLEAALDKYQPATIINCAAYTDIDGAEVQRRQAFMLNAISPSYLGRLAEARNIKLCHYSTEYVFDGKPDNYSLYTEKSLPNPVNWYGMTKAFGEFNLVSCSLNSLVIRTSWVYGEGFPDCFPLKVLDRLEKGAQPEIVCDRSVAPTWVDDLVEATIKLLDKNVKGLVHFSGGQPVSLFDFAQQIAELGGYSAKAIKPVSSESQKLKALRPPFAILDTSYYSELVGEKAPSWKNSLSKFLEIKRISESNKI